MNQKQEISQADFERIEKYLSNKMAEDEKLDFEKELIVDSVLKSKFDELKALLEGVEKVEFKEVLNQFHQEMEAENKNQGEQVWFNRKSLLVAASVLIIAIISVLYFNKPKNNEQLFAQFYKTDPGLVTAMSSKEMDYEFERGMVDFKSGEIQSAIERWNPLLAENPASDTLNYFLGVADLELKNTSQAIQRLQNVAGNPQSKFADDANWYLALAYILEDRKTEAVRALNQTSHASKEDLLNQLGEK